MVACKEALSAAVLLVVSAPYVRGVKVAAEF